MKSERAQETACLPTPWEQKGEHKEHLSVLEFKREKRKEEIAKLEQTFERVQQKQVSVQAVEQKNQLSISEG